MTDVGCSRFGRGRAALPMLFAWLAAAVLLAVIPPAAQAQAAAVSRLGFVPARAAGGGFHLDAGPHRFYFSAEGIAVRLAGSRRGSSWSVRIDFEGARRVAPVAAGAGGTRVSHFSGSAAEWTSVRSSTEIVYRELWAGIDLRLSAADRRLKYEYLVSPGASPAAIRLRYRGASLSLDGQALSISTPAGVLRDEPPIAYQEIDGERRPVTCAYQVESDRCGFELGAWDPTRALVIDPVLLVSCGYFGGDLEEEVLDLTVDRQGYLYLVGAAITRQDSFPVRVGPDSTYNGGWRDAFVAKLTPDAAEILYCGYLGGRGYEWAAAVAVDETGAAYLAGMTDSTEASFPVRRGPILTLSKYREAFVAKVAPDGSELEYCGYIGGSGYDYAADIVVDRQGRATVCGGTDSEDLPVRVGPSLSLSRGEYSDDDGFLARVSEDGSTLEFCGYLGGTGTDYVASIALAPDGSVCAAGTTFSVDGPFPAPEARAAFHHEPQDGFIARIAADGSRILSTRRLGGDSADSLSYLRLDGSGRLYVAGYTRSDEESLPVTVGPDLTANRWRSSDYLNYGGFVARLSADLETIEYCGYLSGELESWIRGIALDDRDRLLVCGVVWSSDRGFPVLPAPNPVARGSKEAFVARVSESGAELELSGFVGGEGEDRATDIEVGPDGSVWVAGNTTSAQTSFPVREAGDMELGRVIRRHPQQDGFLARFAEWDLAPGDRGKLGALPAQVGLGSALRGSERTATVTLRNRSGRNPLVVDVPRLPEPFEASPTGVLRIPAQGQAEVTITFRPTARIRYTTSLVLTTSDPKRPLAQIPILGRGR
ncbi:MAG: hypothetical protein ACK47B_06655 [Armatimonadota bacterium]